MFALKFPHARNETESENDNLKIPRIAVAVRKWLANEPIIVNLQFDAMEIFIIYSILRSRIKKVATDDRFYDGPPFVNGSIIAGCFSR